MARLAGLLWAWLPALVWMALILSLSGQSNLPARANPQSGEMIRTTFAAAKLAHVFEYSVLGLLLLRALMHAAGGLRVSPGAAVLAAVAVSALFGGLDEMRQSFVPNREPRLADIALDTASALAACLIAVAWLRFGRNRRPSTPSAPPVAHGTHESPAPPSGNALG